MDYVVAVQISHPTHYLPEIKGRKVLFEVILLSYLLEEAAISSKLKEEVDFIGIVKEPVHFKDVWMVGEKLDFDLLG